MAKNSESLHIKFIYLNFILRKIKYLNKKIQESFFMRTLAFPCVRLVVRSICVRKQSKIYPVTFKEHIYLKDTHLCAFLTILILSPFEIENEFITHIQFLCSAWFVVIVSISFIEILWFQYWLYTYTGITYLTSIATLVV